MTIITTTPPSMRTGDGERDARQPLVRLGALLDPGSLESLHDAAGSGVVTVRGRIDGSAVIAYCTDATVKGGAISGQGARLVADAIDVAHFEGVPVIGVWHSGGAQLAEGVLSMDGIGEMFAAMTRASGRVPQLSVVLGPAAGAAAYGPALTDLIIMSEQGRVFVTGPDVVRSVTGEEISMRDLGGVDAHSSRSGVVHMVTRTEAEAFDQARILVNLLADQRTFDPSQVVDNELLETLLPESPRRAYDVRPVVRALLDGPFQELQPKWARNVVVGFGRFAGRTVGVVANNPLRKGGCLDSLSAEKSARFVRLCDAFGVPLLVLVDVPGYLPGSSQEWDGVVRRGAKLLHAFAEAVVPRITLITRKSYGGAYIAMNSRSLGATTVYAWPQAEVAVMGAEAAVGILHRRTLAAATDADLPALRERLIAEHERESGGVRRALALGVVDEVIQPERTRTRLAQAFAAAPQRRGTHGNIPL